MPELKVIHTPELRGLYANSNRFTQPNGTVPRLSNLYLVRRGAFHTVPGSLWVSSYDGLAPHSTVQLPVEQFQWYSPSAGSSPDLYMAAFASINPHNFLVALWRTNAPGVELINVSGFQSQWQELAAANIALPATNHFGVNLLNYDMAQFSDYLIAEFGNSTPPYIFPTYTQVSIAIESTDTSVQVLSTLPFPPTGFILIGTEVIQYAAVTPTSFTGLTRGAHETTAASHAVGAPILLASNQAVTLVTQIPFMTAAQTTAPVSSTTGFPSAGYILIDSEVIQYTSVAFGVFLGLTRGSSGTNPAIHFLGAKVYSINAPPAPPDGAVWAPIVNSFDPSLVYSKWPGLAYNDSTTNPNASVNIGTLIYAIDGMGIAWLFRAQNSGIPAWGLTYGGPPFFANSLHGTDGAINNGSPTLNSAAGEFTRAMVDLGITVQGAGAAGGNLVTTVLAYVSATQITLDANAGTTVSSAGIFDIVGNGHYGDTAKDFNTATTGHGAQSGTEVWVNVGQAALSPPGAAFVFQYLDSLFLWGVGANYGNDGITGPDALWQSDTGLPTFFNPAYTTFVGKGDGTTAQGGAVYSLSEAGIAATPQLVLFKDASTYSFLNSFPLNEALVPVSGGLGCVAPDTIQFIGGLGVIRLSYAGITVFDGQLEHVTEYTDAIRGYLFPEDAPPGIVPVDWSNIVNCVSTQSINPPMYLMFAPLVGGAPLASGTDGETAANTFEFDSPSDPFTVAMVGGTITILGAGPGGSTLVTTIATFINSGRITLTVAPSVSIPTTAVFSVVGPNYPTRAFGYDFGLKQWFVMDLPFPVSAAAFLPQAVAAVARQYQSVIGGAADGTVRRILFGDPDWDGTSIISSMQMPDFGYPGTPVYIRRLNVRITADGGGATPAITAATFSGVRRSGRGFSRPLNTPASILGSLDVGETVLSGAVSITVRGQVLIEGSDAQTSDKPTGRVGK